MKDTTINNDAVSAWDALPYIYLLRVQIVSLLALLSFPFFAMWFAPNLLLGVFDVTPWGMVFVTLSAALASWTVMVTTWQVFLYGPKRFRIRRFPFGSSILEELPTRGGSTLVFALFALPVILAAMYVSKNDGTSTYPRLLLGVAGGAGLAVAILAFGDQFNSQKWSEVKPVTAFLSYFGPGFKKQDGKSAYEGHYTAFWSFLLCFLVYVAIGIGKFFRIGDPTTVPTLADVLVLLMILCWGLSAVAFILDLFRVPLLLPFLVAAILSTQFHDTDSYFYMFSAKSTPDLSPAQVIRAGKPGSAVIVVAASGGGIKAAAWTTRVLTGLEESNPHIFGDSVRLISAVSGGSVGAMYFVNEYEANAGLPSNTNDLEEAVARAEASSLDDIAWGVVYADFIHVFVPFFKHLDRGTALEAALTRELPNGKDHLFSPLADWREGVLEGWRPAVVFNATVVESGERFLLGTTDLSPARGRTSLRDREFPQFAGRDISLVTAARLSATFPYVSPAARPDIAGKQIHAVDGGYTDNYGMATLLAWLDEALRAPGNPIRRVLIIEIRASPPAAEPPPLSWRGWSFQSYAPISAMLNVRDTGQLPRNEEELDILRHFAASCNIDIEDSVFEYPPENAPLSWHLSPNDKKAIETIWRSSGTDKPKQTVRVFLAAPPPPLTTPPPSACQ